MSNNQKISTRTYSFLLSALMDGVFSLMQTAVPLMALQFNASAWFMGMLGWIPQAVRLPICFLSGILSDRIGRIRVIIPAVIVTLVSCLLLSTAKSNIQLLVIYIFLFASAGAYFPSLQAFIGDHSPKGELRKNLASFNLGWTIGSSVCGLIAGYLFMKWFKLPFYVGALLIFILLAVIMSWSKQPSISDRSNGTDSAVPLTADELTANRPNPLLLIARMGHFLGFFGYGLTRNIFPKLGAELHFNSGTIGILTGTMLVGQATGMIVTGISPWWQGKLWPQIAAQSMMVTAGILVYNAASPLALGIAFFIQGLALGTAYTGALYYGLQTRVNMGRNTGIHEGLVASGVIIGSLVGGTTAQFISLRSPYIAFSGLALLSIIFCLIYTNLPALKESREKG
ncbi:MAG: MFS transporter [Armatimonadota bacterium]